MLATTGDDGALRIWDPRTGEELQSFQRRDGAVFAPSFSPNDDLVAATWNDEGIVEIRDLASGRVVQEIGPYRLESFGMSFSPDGRQLAIPTADGTVVVAVDSGAAVLEMLSDDTVLDADWSPNGRWIAASHEDGTVRLFDAATGSLRYRLFAQKVRIWSADWSPDSTRLATASADGTAKSGRSPMTARES